MPVCLRQQMRWPAEGGGEATPDRSFYRKETEGRFAAALGCTKRGARTGVCCREGGN
ncbi:hypothetical protein CK203_090002 [Vitis vinifera]|uniref:Uncharacterized protein n=1 Tax=Vitis vinifera TaxID=29760 RepID=A0A438BSE6_VITVI|nr:hypothetical protein CK203_090002 [Vitis vinifera]